jgi:hypothetical protein
VISIGKSPPHQDSESGSSSERKALSTASSSRSAAGRTRSRLAKDATKSALLGTSCAVQVTHRWKGVYLGCRSSDLLSSMHRTAR